MKNVMLVDDSRTMLMSISGILSIGGYAPSTATSGADALQQLQGGYRPDLVITDLNMPGMNGIELIRSMRRLPAMRFTPILMLTTESQVHLRTQAKDAGATGWLVKPVQADRFLNVLRKVLPA